MHQPALPKKYSYLEFLWFVFSRIWTEYGGLLYKSMYWVRMRENTDQKKSEYRYCSRNNNV